MTTFKATTTPPLSLTQGTQQRSKTLAVAFLALLSILYLFPEFAHAASPFASGTQTGKSDILAMVAPFAGIAVIAVGLACLFGKISWWWLAGVIFGIVLVFGHDQFISWIRSIFSV